MSGRKLDDPARRPKARFRENPKQHLIEYNELSTPAREDYAPDALDRKGV